MHRLPREGLQISGMVFISTPQNIIMTAGRLPNFLIVGAAKSGTTSLWRYLNEHPEVFMSPKKEPLFFISEFIRDLNPEKSDCRHLIENAIYDLSSYKKLFIDAKNEKALGEASVGYLSFADIAIPKIKETLGEVKIVMVLRNPIERAYSAFTHQSLLGSESLDFESALLKEKERISRKHNPGLYYVRNGFYVNRVKAYLDNFANVKIYLFDDLKNDIGTLVKDLFEFLDIDQSFQPDLEKQYNVSGIPKSRLVQHFLVKPYLSKKLVPIIRPAYRAVLPEKTRYHTIPKLLSILKARNVKKVAMQPQTRKKLLDIYRQEILDLQYLLNRNLEHWLA